MWSSEIQSLPLWEKKVYRPTWCYVSNKGGKLDFMLLVRGQLDFFEQINFQKLSI
jgi:hypothetical protein